jgi:Carboxylesterase.
MKYRGKCLFTPTTERGVAEGEETFLEGNPMDLMTQGKFHKVPYLSGLNSHEGLLMLKGKKFLFAPVLPELAAVFLFPIYLLLFLFYQKYN